MSVHEGAPSSTSENQNCSETVSSGTIRSRGDGGKRVPHVWAPLVSRAALGVLLLAGVTYLGHLSNRLDHYGPIRRLDERIMKWAEAPSEGSEKTARVISSSDEIQGAASGPFLAQATRVSPAEPSSKESAPARPEKLSDCLKKKRKVPTGLTSDGRVILNEATAAELTTLSGIGSARAEAILKLRTRLKKFRKVADLLRIRGIGWKSLQKLKDKVVVDRPVESPDASEAHEGSETPAVGASEKPGSPPSRNKSKPTSSKTHEKAPTTSSKVARSAPSPRPIVSLAALE